MSKNRESYEYMKRITEQLFLMKTNTDFSYPLNDYFRGYKSVISHPMDLTTVKNKLTKGAYKSAREWYNDVCLIYENCVKYYSQSEDRYTADLYITLANYNLAEFKKMTPALSCGSDKEWNAVVQKSRNKLLNLIAERPLELDAKCEIPSVRGDVELSRREIEDAVKALNEWLGKDSGCEERRRDVLRILRQTENGIDLEKDEIVIDAEKLQQSTLNALWVYAKANAE